MKENQAIKSNSLVKRRKSWFRGAFKLQYSVFTDVWEKSLFFAVFTTVICVLHNMGIPVKQPTLSSLIPTIVLGLLLVFRTNSANDRFWEGRKLWGGIVNNIRNLTWQMWTNISTNTPEQKQEKINCIYLLPVFAISAKNRLRSQGVTEDMKHLLTPEYYQELKNNGQYCHLPLQVAGYIGEYLREQYDRQVITSHQLGHLQSYVTNLIDMLGGCERILKTPIPNSYSIHLKQLLLIYCLVLPFQYVGEINWWTIPFVAVVSYIVYGIEAIALEIENPFGNDCNDLPLDQICLDIEDNINNFIAYQENQLQLK